MKQEFILRNGQIKVDDLQQYFQADVVVYEVLRVIDGIPLFFNDHFVRLLKSLNLIGRTIELHQHELFLLLYELATVNNMAMGNIKLKVSFWDKHYEVLARFIPHHYPEKESYLKGVDVGLLYAQRMNPEAKVENISVRERANEQIQQSGVYEVILVDQKNRMTEGSRSNLMGIKNGMIYTAPFSMVLLGITLQKTLQVATDLGLRIRYECITLDMLHTFDALCLTGTSPKIIPVLQVQGLYFDPINALVTSLTEGYEQMIQDEIEKKRIP
ncbi:MAG: aminotransferase class IV [Prolixibacteraceae bacterium]